MLRHTQNTFGPDKGTLPILLTYPNSLYHYAHSSNRHLELFVLLTHHTSDGLFSFTFTHLTSNLPLAPLSSVSNPGELFLRCKL
jgi:hypothetical protein